MEMRTTRNRKPGGTPLGAGVTLLELLCVMAIIAILASMLLPTYLRAYNKVRGLDQEWEADAILSLLNTQTRNYCASHPQYAFPTALQLADQCSLTPKPREWVLASTTAFVPFGFQTDTNLVVLTFHIGPRHATVYPVTKGELTVQPQRR
jgi:prepilin-type N-terminal cleavage/methylation domain-containing protein